MPFEGTTAFLMEPHETEVGTVGRRMLERHKRIIDANIDYIRGRTILDLASHNGRWSYAALQAGASYVFGIEGRQAVIDLGKNDFQNIDPSRFKFVCGDIFNLPTILQAEGRTQFDTVFCLGIFYHITDHYRLIRLMRGVNPAAIILDTSLINDEQPIVKFKIENTRDRSMTIPEGPQHDAMAGRASIGFLKKAAQLSGYDVAFVPWKADETEYPDPVKDYFYDSKESRRYTIRLTATHDKPKWRL